MRWGTWLKVQVAVVIAGAVLTGFATVVDFYRYLLIGGDLSQFNGMPLPNPFATPVFFAAVGFAFAARLAWRQLKQPTTGMEVAVGALSLAGVVLGLA